MFVAANGSLHSLSLSLATSAPQKPQSRIPAERYRFILGDRGIVAATTLYSQWSLMRAQEEFLRRLVQRCDSSEFVGIFLKPVRPNLCLSGQVLACSASNMAPVARSATQIKSLSAINILSTSSTKS